jgi:hypothetical protein
MGISDDMIRAAIQTGQFDDEESIAFLTNALIHRRNSIARTYLSAINPIVDPVLSEDGTLKFGNAAVDAGVAKHQPIIRLSGIDLIIQLENQLVSEVVEIRILK